MSDEGENMMVLDANGKLVGQTTLPVSTGGAPIRDDMNIEPQVILRVDTLANLDSILRVRQKDYPKVGHESSLYVAKIFYARRALGLPVDSKSAIEPDDNDNENE